MLRRFLSARSGVSATEFALIAPILCLVLLGIIDGWSYATSVINMRAAVKAGVNYVIQGGGTEATAQLVALSSWVRPPDDASVSVAQVCLCSSTPAPCDALCSGTTNPPSAFFQLEATGTWIPPVPVALILKPRELSHQETIRVR